MNTNTTFGFPEKEPQQTNPFPKKHSAYVHMKQWEILKEQSLLSKEQLEAYDKFETYVTNPDFPCTGGDIAWKQKNLAFCVYEDMTSPEVASGVCHDIFQFIQDFNISDMVTNKKPKFNSFVAVFQNTIPAGPEGAKPLHTLFKNMHEVNKQHFEWAPKVSKNVHDPNFSFSVAGEAFFTVFIHPEAFMKVRQSGPGLTVVLFNPQKMFEAFKQKQIPGKDQSVFEYFEHEIRANVVKVQECLHPYVSTQGEGVSSFYQTNAEDPKDKDAVQEVIDEVYNGEPFEE